MQMPPVVELDELEDLHRHVRLVHERARERQVPEVPALGVAQGQVDVRYVGQPVSVLSEELGAAPSVEDLGA